MKLCSSMIVVLVALSACTPKDKTEAKPSASTAEANSAPMIATSAAAAAADAAVSISAADDPLPARANLAREARREISAKNYKTELDKIEKDIDPP